MTSCICNIWTAGLSAVQDRCMLVVQSRILSGPCLIAMIIRREVVLLLLFGLAQFFAYLFYSSKRGSTTNLIEKQNITKGTCSTIWHVCLPADSRPHGAVRPTTYGLPLLCCRSESLIMIRTFTFVVVVRVYNDSHLTRKYTSLLHVVN